MQTSLHPPQARRDHGGTHFILLVVVVYYKDESECNAQMDAHAQRPRHQDNIQAHHQTHRLRKSMGKESARGELPTFWQLADLRIFPNFQYYWVTFGQINTE